MKPSLSALSAALVLLCSIVNASIVKNEISSHVVADGSVSLLYRNTDDSPAPTATNLNIRPDFRLVNHSDDAIPYSNITVRYWYTVENQAGNFAEIIFAKFGEENVIASFHELAEPRQNANFYVEYAFTTGAGLLPAHDTTIAFIRTRLRKSNYSKFNELNDYSYKAPGQTYASEEMTVYLNGELVWGIEPPVVAPVEDLRIDYSKGSPTTNLQIMMVLHFLNFGNTNVPLSSVKLRYWFSENPAYPLQYIEHYIADDNIHTTGTIVSFSPEREAGTNHYLEVAFSAPGVVVKPYSDLRGFKLKLIRDQWKPFTSTTDDYSYNGNTSEYTYVQNEHITLYINDVLVWGVEPAEVSTLNDGAVAEAETLQGAKLYPIPAKTSVTLDTQDEMVMVGQVKVFDFSGRPRQVSYVIENGKLIFDVTRLEKGIYYLNAELNRKSYKKRLIID